MIKSITIAAVLAVSALASFDASADPVNEMCKSLSGLAASVASDRIRGVPKEGIDRSLAPGMQSLRATQPDVAELTQTMVDITYRPKWSPSEAHNKIWSTCLNAL